MPDAYLADGQEKNTNDFSSPYLHLFIAQGVLSHHVLLQLFRLQIGRHFDIPSQMFLDLEFKRGCRFRLTMR